MLKTILTLFRGAAFRAEEDFADRSALLILDQGIQARDNILISGGTGTGKTTLLNALATLLPPEDRLVLIEDTAELQLEALNL